MCRTRTLRVFLFAFILFNIFDVLRIHHNLSREPTHTKTTAAAARRQLTSRPRERIYIAGMHFNNGDILKKHWNNAVIELTELFGPENVFVSIYESGSWDDTKQVLFDLDRQLESRGVPRRVEVSDVTHKDEMSRHDKGEGWIDTPRNRRELRRIPYLAKIRNKTLQDLFELHKNGTTFDKVLFLNDVVFTVSFPIERKCCCVVENVQLTGVGWIDGRCSQPLGYQRW